MDYSVLHPLVKKYQKLYLVSGVCLTVHLTSVSTSVLVRSGTKQHHSYSLIFKLQKYKPLTLAEAQLIFTITLLQRKHCLTYHINLIYSINTKQLLVIYNYTLHELLTFQMNLKVFLHLSVSPCHMVSLTRGMKEYLLLSCSQTICIVKNAI